MTAERLSLFILYTPAFLFALACHEAAHGLVAHRLGDSTAKDAGRLTLNPFAHMDLLGTVLLPLVSWLAPGSLPIAGWGKPVPVDEARLQNPRRDGLWIALAGPLSNLGLALGFALLLRALLEILPALGGMPWAEDPLYASVAETLLRLVEISIWINLGLALFNLIPVHPLDGGKVLSGLLPERWARSYDRMARYGIFAIVVLFYVGGFRYLRVPVQRMAEFLIPS